MKSFFLTLLLPLTLCTCVSAQNETPGKVKLTREMLRDYDPKTESVYKVRPWIEGLGIGVGGMLISTVGIDRLREKDPVNAADLRREDVWGVDRWAFPANAEARERAEASSDIGFNGAILLPLTLFVSKKIRKDFVDVLSLYIETHAFNSLTYAYTPLGPTFIDRIRPVSYYPELDDADPSTRVVGNNRNSFFSGHVSTTATGTFFFAKVLSDYNPQWNGGQRALLFGAASLPPVYVAVQRVRALKHFPTDTVVGLGVGALVGIMNPHVHKRWRARHRSELSFGGGFSDGAGGAGLSLRF